MGVNQLPDLVLAHLALRGASWGMAVAWSDLWDLNDHTSRSLTLFFKVLPVG